jgi:RHS repeat-associated protein
MQYERDENPSCLVGNVVRTFAAGLVLACWGISAQAQVGSGNLMFNIDNFTVYNGYNDGGTAAAVTPSTQLTGTVEVSGVTGNGGSTSVYCYANSTTIFSWSTSSSAETTFSWTAPSSTGSNTLYCSGTWTGEHVNGTVSTPDIVVPVEIQPTLSMTASPTSSIYGQSVTFTATISSGPTGSISFYNGSTAIGSGTISGTTATYTTSTLAAGSYSVYASYPGSSTYMAVSSNTVAVTVSQATPSISVTSSTNPSTYGSSVTFTASVPSGDTNTVTLYNGSTALGTATPSSGTATVVSSSLPAGSDSVTASIAAGGNYAANTSSAITQTVNQAVPSISLASSANPSSFGTSVTFTATFPSGSSGTVTFYDHGLSIGTATISGTTATLATNALIVGSHVITASWPGNANFYSGESGSLTQTVNGVWDSGTVNLTVSNRSSGASVYTASTSYGQASTPSSLASALAGTQANIEVTAVNDSLYIQAFGTGTTGTATDYTYAVTSTWNTTYFAQASFAGTPPSGDLEGGDNSGTGQVVYSYCVPGPSNPNPNSNCTSSASSYDGDGNVREYIDSVMGTWALSYDTLNRLASATSSPATGQSANPYPDYCWNFDSFGNRTEQMSANVTFASGMGGPNQGSNVCSTTGTLGQNIWAQYNGTVNGTNNNQISASSQNANQGQTGGYDAAGDITYDGVNQYLYDAEGRICAVLSMPVSGYRVMTGYVYDAEGRRIAKGTITTWSCDPSVNGLTTAGNDTDYILDSSGDQLTEMSQEANGNLVWQHTNAWAGGKLLGTYDTNGLHFYFDDPLGTRRAQTDYAGNPEQFCSSLPFGDQLSCTSANTGTSGQIYAASLTAPTEHHFTGKERDAESGNDYFEARYYSSAMGRFLSADWAAKEEPVPYATFDDPQSLNLYSYVRNNPLARTDPDGHCCWDEFKDFMNGANGAYLSDETVGLSSRDTPSSEAGQTGALFGDALALAQGAGETIIGSDAAAGGTLEALATSPAAGTGVGAIVPAAGAAVAVVGAVVTVHGVASGVTAAKNILAMALNKSKTGPGSVPKDQRAKPRVAGEKERTEMRKEQGGNCAHCDKPLNGDEISHHYPERHSDGGTEQKLVHDACHQELHGNC